MKYALIIFGLFGAAAAVWFLTKGEAKEKETEKDTRTKTNSDTNIYEDIDITPPPPTGAPVSINLVPYNQMIINECIAISGDVQLMRTIRAQNNIPANAFAKIPNADFRDTVTRFFFDGYGQNPTSPIFDLKSYYKDQTLKRNTQVIIEILEQAATQRYGTYGKSYKMNKNLFKIGEVDFFFLINDAVLNTKGNGSDPTYNPPATATTKLGMLLQFFKDFLADQNTQTTKIEAAAIARLKNKGYRFLEHP